MSNIQVLRHLRFNGKFNLKSTTSGLMTLRIENICFTTIKIKINRIKMLTLIINKGKKRALASNGNVLSAKKVGDIWRHLLALILNA